MSQNNDKQVLNIEPKVNVALRTAILVLLCCQNAGHALLTRYSQGNDRYISKNVNIADYNKFYS
jgi:hypothetical protein